MKHSNSPELVTYALFSYNQQEYILEAIASAFEQTYQPLEIIISDDCSTDKTFEKIVEAVANYHGHHVVRINRNSERLGVAAHINKVASMSRGEWIVGAAGDDISLPERIAKLMRFVACIPEKPYSVWSGCKIIDERSHVISRLPGYDKTLHSDHSILVGPVRPRGASHMFRKELFEVFGPLEDDVVHEDICLPYRALLLGKVAFMDEDLVLYRRSDRAISNSGRVARTVQDYNDLSSRFDVIVGSYLQMLVDLINYERDHPGFLATRRGKLHYATIRSEIAKHRTIAKLCRKFPDLGLSDAFQATSVFSMKLVIKAILYRTKQLFCKQNT